MPEAQIVLIDIDNARREQIRALLEAAGVKVAAFRSAADFDAHRSTPVLFLIADEKRALQSMAVFLSQYPDPPVIIAYRPEPAVHDVVEAMKLGATDYLAWPFRPAALLQRLTSLERAGEELAAGAAPVPRPNSTPGALVRPAQREARALRTIAVRIRARFASSPVTAPTALTP